MILEHKPPRMDLEPPVWCQVVPPGKTLDGRDQAALVQSFTQNFKESVPVDFDHNSTVQNGETRAAGWVVALRRMSGNRLDCAIRWTKAGAEAIASGTYRFLSGAWTLDKSPTFISVGLTNTPALNVPCLAIHSKSMNPEDQKDEEVVVNAEDAPVAEAAPAAEEQGADPLTLIEERLTKIEERLNALESAGKQVSTNRRQMPATVVNHSKAYLSMKPGAARREYFAKYRNEIIGNK